MSGQKCTVPSLIYFFCNFPKRLLVQKIVTVVCICIILFIHKTQKSKTKVLSCVRSVNSTYLSEFDSHNFFKDFLRSHNFETHSWPQRPQKRICQIFLNGLKSLYFFQDISLVVDPNFSSRQMWYVHLCIPCMKNWIT